MTDEKEIAKNALIAAAMAAKNATTDTLSKDKTENVQAKGLDGKQIYAQLNEFIQSVGDGEIAYINKENDGSDKGVWIDEKGSIYIGGTNLHVTPEGKINETYTKRKAVKLPSGKTIPAIKGVREVSKDNKYLAQIPEVIESLSQRKSEAEKGKTFQVKQKMMHGLKSR